MDNFRHMLYYLVSLFVLFWTPNRITGKAECA